MIREFWISDAEAVLSIDAAILDNVERMEVINYPFDEVRWVFDFNNKVVGYLFVNLDTCEITNFAFDEQHQRKGYGTRLFKHAVNWLKANNKLGAFVTVNSANANARRFYEGQGFRDVAKLPGHFQGEDAIFMAGRL